MKNLLILLSIVILSGACNTSTNNETDSSRSNSPIVLSIGEFYDNPDNYTGKEVTIRGLVTHVCKHGGQKLFIENEEDNGSLRIDVGENISEFDIQMEGSVIEFTGIIYQMNEEFVVAAEEELAEHHNDEDVNCPSEEEMPASEKSYHLVAQNFESR